MKKWLKFAATGLLSSSIIITSISPVCAQSGSILEKITDLETTEDFAEDTSYSLLRGNNLNYGSAKISKLASNKINVYGYTQCHHKCDEVYLDLFLERKVNGSYGTYKSWEFTDTNVSNLTASIDVIVPSGYYYRIRGYHAAKDGSKESTTTLTDGILVK
ncbi:MAG TPA: hypothetical protein IAA06_10635 [Candidatus Blautia faecavium]|uniref:Secreted protein n=1 Tax=Candidatus Blautia faecavium TaxID=2838487 RepID=A0A9D2RWG7_9FIRM|nr:hypothetical protein [Candidatus Blautia faecavium]